MPEPINTAIAYITPILFVAWIMLVVGRKSGLLRPDKTFRQIAVLLLAVPLALERTGGASVAQVALLLSPGYSALSMGLLVGLIMSEMWGRKVFTRKDWMLLSGFILLLSAFLYPSSLGITGYDAYWMGYRFSWVFAAVAAYTVVLAFIRSPMAWVLVFAILMFDLRLLPHSRNFFDYLVDGPLLLATIGAVIFRLVRRPRSQKPGTSSSSGYVTE